MSNEQSIEIRRLPKKTIIIISVMAVICILGFIFIQLTKNMKMEEVLSSLGHKNIENIKVLNKIKAEDRESKEKNTVYKVVFDDIDSGKKCMGFVIKSNRGKYSKDLDCK